MLLDDPVKLCADILRQHDILKAEPGLYRFEQAFELVCSRVEADGPRAQPRIKLGALRLLKDLLNLLGNTLVSHSSFVGCQLERGSPKAFVVTSKVTSQYFDNLICRSHILSSFSRKSFYTEVLNQSRVT